MSRSFELDPAVRFTAGAVGEPGDRVFYIQARGGDDLCTLLCEKEQVFLLARELRRVLSMLPPGSAEGDDEPVDGYDLELVEPLEPDWRVGGISIEFDPERDRVIVLLRELDVEAVEAAAEAALEAVETGEPLPDDDDDDDDAERFVGEAIARIVVTRAQVDAMVEHALDVVSAGRPRCPVCSEPMEAGVEHRCVAMNGHKHRG